MCHIHGKHHCMDTVIKNCGLRDIKHNTFQTKNTATKIFCLLVNNVQEINNAIITTMTLISPTQKGNRIKLKWKYPFTWLLYHPFLIKNKIPSYNPSSWRKFELGGIFNKISTWNHYTNMPRINTPSSTTCTSCEIQLCVNGCY